MIRDLWQNGTNSVHDIRVVNTDAKSHLANTPERCLQEAEWVNNKMCLETCLQQQRNLFRFIISVDRLLGVEPGATLVSFNSRLATNW